MDTEKELANSLKSRRKITEDSYYRIPYDWYLLWKRHLKGGTHPGTLNPQKLMKPDQSFTTPSKSKDRYVTESEFSILKSKYCGLCLPAAEEAEPNDNNLCETPKASPAELKFSRNLKQLASMTKPPTFDNSVTMSTTPSFKRSFSTLNTLIRQRPLSSAKITFWCEGNYSMLNACLQLFLSIQSLSEYFIEKYFTGNFISRPLSSSFSQMFLTKTMLKTGKVDTSSIKNHLVHNFPQINDLSFPQLFRLIIDEVIEEYEENEFLTKNVFNGRILKETTCNDCDFKKEEEENFNDLSLEVCKTLERSFEIFNREDRMTSFCSNCNQFTIISHRNTIVQLPSYLVLNMKRFVQSPYLHKNNLITETSKKLRINEEKFLIKAVVYHDGDIYAGEYLFYAKVNSKWFEYRGKKCSKVSLDDVLSLPGLIYLYEKQSF